MNVLGYVVGGVGLVYGTVCYLHLRRWAHLLRHGRIAIAYKSKVKHQAPLEEWALWAKKLQKNDTGGSQMLYYLNGTSVSIIGKVVPPGRLRSAWRMARRKSRGHTPTAPVQTGRWTGRDDAAK